MALDVTDTKLVKGSILFVVLGLAIYFYPFSWPFESYQAKSAALDRTRQELAKVRERYVGPYAAPDPSAFGDPDGKLDSVAYKWRMADLRSTYVTGNADLAKLIAEKQAACRMSFAEWTNVPPQERQPGVHFGRTWDRTRLRLEDDCRRAYVELVDRDIGFSKWGGGIQMTKTEAEELLRELFIAETVINLCVKAKLEEEQDEKAKGHILKAFMRIVSVSPEKSSAKGPILREENSLYDKRETNPKSAKFKKYNIQQLHPFIQEYPVEIKLQCDVNSFMRFLHSVRSKGHFLVIRNLTIVSPFMNESLKDTSELKSLSATATERQVEVKDKDEHIWVKMSAAGMDFFDPEKGGLMPSASGNKAAASASRRPSSRRGEAKATGH